MGGKRKLLPAELLQVLLLLRRCVIRIPRALRRQCCGAGVVERKLSSDLWVVKV